MADASWVVSNPQIAEASHHGLPKHLPSGAAPSPPDARAWFERERWELQLHDCLRAAEKHKLDGKSLFEQQDFQVRMRIDGL